MNKKISLVLAGLSIAGALAGCGTLHATSTGGALKATATSSAVKSEAAAAGKAILSTCVPKGTVINEQYLISLAVKPSQAAVLAESCGVPKGKRVLFAKAVLISAGNAYMRGSFKTKAGQQEWADKVFPVILTSFQAK